MTSEQPAPGSAWKYYEWDGGWWQMFGRDCEITIEKRPHYCDRGNFIAKIHNRPDGDARRLNLDGADGWPRYYFDLDRAKLEIEAWLEKRQQAI